MSEFEDENIDEMKCSHCGKYISADIMRCPECGNYTDGLGKFGDGVNSDGREPMPRIFKIAGWLLLLSLVLPILLALYQWANQH